MTGISQTSSPVRQRWSRSAMQWRYCEQKSATRGGRSLDVSFQVIPSSAANGVNTALNAARSNDCALFEPEFSARPSSKGPPPARAHSTRMKKRPRSWSMCWSAWRMLAPRSYSSPDTRATSPLRSGQSMSKTAESFIVSSDYGIAGRKSGGSKSGACLWYPRSQNRDLGHPFDLVNANCLAGFGRLSRSTRGRGG